MFIIGCVLSLFVSLNYQAIRAGIAGCSSASIFILSHRAFSIERISHRLLLREKPRVSCKQNQSHPFHSQSKQVLRLAPRRPRQQVRLSLAQPASSIPLGSPLRSRLTWRQDNPDTDKVERAVRADGCTRVMAGPELECVVEPTAAADHALRA
jgi:hypothetical protein